MMRIHGTRSAPSALQHGISRKPSIASTRRCGFPKPECLRHRSVFLPSSRHHNSLRKICSGLSPLKTKRTVLRPSQRTQAKVEARVKDPDLAPTDEENPDLEPPTAFWKALSAAMYLIPWIDSVGMGREIYRKFPSFILLYFAPSPFFSIYYCNQFAPLIIFFLMFLAIVKNTKLSHFIRFNCMQAVMLDIGVMLFSILHMYFPAEIRWSPLLFAFDMCSWMICMTTVLYCVFFTLKGWYADIPFVSEAVYIQVELSEYA